MDTLDRAALQELREMRQRPCVSMFMPTHPTGRDQQDPIRLKNLLRQAESRLSEIGVRPADVCLELKRVHDLVEDSAFWRLKGDGLAVFVAPEFERHMRLPVAFDELVVVADRFHMKPLLATRSDDHFYVLALSQNGIRLLRGGRQSVHELELADVPASLADALKYDDREATLQSHSASRAGRGATVAAFHGQGVGRDNSKEDIRRYFRLVDRGLRNVLRTERAPLVLAGVDYLMPLYRDITEYRYVASEGIEGNPDRAPAEDLSRRAWEIVEPLFGEARRRAAARYEANARTSAASDDLKRTLRASYAGRVDSLFVAVGPHRWGQFEPTTGAIAVHEEWQPGDEDLLDATAVYTWIHGGAVHAVAPEEVPGGRELAALLRY